VKKKALLAALLILFSAWLRFRDLSARPMHADEAVYAFKLKALLNTEKWAYDPADYHGPVLHHLTSLPVRFFGMNENTLRMLPALFGVLLAVMPLGLAGAIGRAEAIVASALVALSPAMIYYSRYYIPEMLLTLLTAGLIACAYRYDRRKETRWAILAGLLVGLMFATKETAVIAAGCLLLARGKPPGWRHLLAASGVAVLAVVLLLGPREAVQAITTYFGRAIQGDRHVHPWHYYLFLLLRSEIVIVALALVGAIASKHRFVRFIAIYTAAMFLVYSAIPYKTPWCILGFLYGLTLLAGAGAVFLARKQPGALLIAAVFAIQLYTADVSSIYDYAGTSPDIYRVRERLEKFRNEPIQVISAQNIWPLPWYLRDFPHVEWRRAVTPDMRPARVILATPDVEPALLHQLYEVLPPGQRPLYVNLFEKPTELRFDFELRGYVQQSAISE
jgi:predicted membrane-bound mannosyltransferase